MVLSKFVIYNFTFYIIYKLINRYKFSKKMESKPIIKSNIRLKEIYDNYYIKKKINYAELDPNILKLMNNNKTILPEIINNNIILSDNLNNLVLNNNNKFIKYSFNTKKENFYKIKFNLISNNINNIKLIISNNKKNYTFDYNEYNLFKEIIKIFNFTLDNNNFDNEKIDIYILLYNNEDTIIIDNMVIEITEFPKNEKKPILIITVNKKNIPIYFENSNLIYG